MADFAAAFAAHGAGRLDEAALGYQAVVAAEPAHADAWHLLGMIAQQRGESLKAIDLINRALALSGPQPLYLSNLGVSLETLGRSSEAVLALEQAVSLGPAPYGTLFALASALARSGRNDEAAARYRQALSLQPDSDPAHNNLGNVLLALNRLDEAETCYRRAVALEPRHVRAHHGLGLALKDQGRHAEAAASFERAIAHASEALLQAPSDVMGQARALARYELGMSYKRLGRKAEAVDHLLAAAEERPDDAAIRNNLANTLIDENRASEAEMHLRHAATLAPALADTHFHLGNALKAQGKSEQALEAYRAALGLRQPYTKARINLSGILLKLARYEEALENYQAGAREDPTSAEVLSGAGVVLQALGRDDEALASFEQARNLNPHLAEAQRNAALSLLMRGDFQRGWEAYEARWQTDGLKDVWRDFGHPVWQGEAGGTVLVWGEQGLGDKVLYASMIPDLMAQGHDVVMETDPRLLALFERSFPGLTAVAKSNPPQLGTYRKDIRWQTPLAGLGRWLRPDLASFPKQSAYLVADEPRRERYRSRLKEGPAALVVGISWGSGNPKIGRHKTLNLAEWEPVLKVPGIRFVDLQYGNTAEERAVVERKLGISITHMDDLDLREDIDGVTALAAACDLVISVSSTVVHIAAAVGCATWVLVPASAGNLWYWMRGGDSTPWYPNVTIFRQRHLGEWRELLLTIEQKLAALAR